MRVAEMRWDRPHLVLPVPDPRHTLTETEDDPNLPGLFFSFFTILKGVGNLTSGPISTILLQSDTLKGAAGAYGQTNYVSRVRR